MEGLHPERAEASSLGKLNFWNLYGVLEYMSFFMFILFQVLYFLLTWGMGCLSYELIKWEYRFALKFWDEPVATVFVIFFGSQVTAIICACFLFFMLSYLLAIFISENRSNVLDMEDNEPIVMDFINAIPGLSRRKLKRIGVYPGSGVLLFWNSMIRANILTDARYIAVGAATINSMNCSELKSFVIFSKSLGLAETTIVHSIVNIAKFQLTVVFVLIGNFLSALNKIIVKLGIFAVLIAPVFLAIMLIGIIVVVLNVALNLLILFSVPIRRKNHFFAAECAAKMTGSRAFLDCLLREKTSFSYFMTAHAFLSKAYHHGFVSPDLYRHMSEIEARHKMEKSEPDKKGTVATADKSKPREPKKRTAKETWDYYQSNIFEEGELENYITRLGAVGEIDRRPSWYLFIGNYEIKKRLTDMYYKEISVHGKKNNSNDKIQSSQFAEEEIKLNKIPDRYRGVYDNRDIEIDGLTDLIKEAKERKIGTEELRSLISPFPSETMVKSVGRLRELRQQEMDLRQDSAQSAWATDPIAGVLGATDHSESARATELQRTHREIEIARKEVAQADEGVFRAHWWLDPTNEQHCQELHTRYFFQLELQKTIPAWTGALDRLNELFASVLENDSSTSVPHDWEHVALCAKNAIQDLLADQPKNTCLRTILHFEEKPLRQELWGDENEVREILNGDWAFTPEFALRLTSLLDTTVKRLVRIRFLNLWTLLHNQEIAVIEWSAKNGG